MAEWVKVFPSAADTIPKSVVDATSPTGFGYDHQSKAQLKTFLDIDDIEAKAVFDQVNVKDYGAVGDGTTDDTTAIQNAINAVAAGGKLVVPKSTSSYKCTAPLTINKYIEIHGESAYQGGLLFVGCNGIEITNVDDVYIKNIKIARSVRYTTDSNTDVGILINGDDTNRPENHTYRDVFIDGFGAAIDSDYLWGSVFDHVNINAAKYGLYVRGLSVNNMVSNCQIGGAGDDESGSKGIYFSGDIASEGWIITDNLIDNFEIAIYGVRKTHCNISNNIIDHCGVYGIYFVHGSSNFTGNHVISGNYIAMSGLSGTAGIQLANGVDNAQYVGSRVSNNMIYVYSGASCTYGVYINGAYDDSNLIINNHIKGFSSADIRCNIAGNSIIGNICLSGLSNDIYYPERGVCFGNQGSVYYQLAEQYLTIGRMKITYSNNIPASGTWAVGDICFNSEPSSAEYIGWTCTIAGTPGTWKSFGVISA